jgi:hypothetical protein
MKTPYTLNATIASFSAAMQNQKSRFHLNNPPGRIKTLTGVIIAV